MTHLLASSTRGAQLFGLLTLIGSLFGFYTYGLTPHIAGLIIAGYFLYGCLGVVVTYHRKLTHNSYHTHSLLTNIFALLGCFAGTGSPLAWVAIHINHHLKSDKPGDPHSPLYKGVKIFGLDYAHEVDSDTKWRMRHMITNRYHQFLHRYYFAIVLAWSALLYVLGGFYWMVFLHWMPAFVTIMMSNVVNYVGHKPTWFGGYRSYNLRDASTNNWVFALPSWGESWHNNHHRFPKNSNFGQKWWEFDISGLIIKFIRT